MKKAIISRFKTAALIALGATLLYCRPAAADNQFLQQGLKEYNSGNFSEAAGHLGASLSTDFYNPVLHYYLANCYIHMKQTSAAVQEFRICFALEPNSDVARYAKQALAYLHADSESPSEPSGFAKPPDQTTTKLPPPPSDPVSKAAASLQQQAAAASAEHSGQSQNLMNDFNKRSTDAVKQAQNKMMDDLPNWYRRSGLPLPPDAQRQLDTLRQLYDGQKAAYTQNAQQQATELQKSAENLQGLLQEKPSKGPHLSPNGTNLYIRNYDGSSSSAHAASKTAH